jgi:Tfp pilus assembly protein PilN
MLTTALRQETEAFTGIPATEMLLGHERLPEEDDIFWVTAYPLDDFRLLKEVLAEKGLKLKRVYPPDCCFTVAAASFAGGGRKKACLVLDAGPGAVRLARYERGRLHSYQTAQLFGSAQFREFTHEDWERLLADLGLERERLAGVWAERQEEETPPLIITGAGSLEESVPVFLKSFFDGDVTPLVMPAGEPAGVGVCGGDYSAVVGAGLRELLYPYLSGRALGVTDQLPFLQLAAQKAYLAPVAVVLLSFAVLGGHYFLIIRQIEAAEAEFAVLARERDEVRGAVARMQGDEKKATELTETRRLLSDKVDYLQNRLPEYSRLLHAVLAAMDAEGGMAIKYVRIELLEQGRQFIVSGESTDSGSVHRLAVALQGERWCAFAKVEEIVREVREEETAEDPGFEEELPGPPPEAGPLPGEELPGMEAEMEPVIMDELPADVPLARGEAVAEEMATVVFKFRTRVVVRPEFFPERPPEETTVQPVTGGTGEGT